MLQKKTPLSEILSISENCERCGHCCSYGSGALIDGDIEKITQHLQVSQEDLKKQYLEEIEKFNTKRFRPKTNKVKDRPYGKCIFLTEDKLCKIHTVKPTGCRVGTCGPDGEKLSIWFSLNCFVDVDDPESIRQWAIYLETHPTINGGTLSELVPDEKRLQKMLEFAEIRKR